METHATRLSRRDPARNMARFYSLWLEPTLFGEVALARNWGRLGTAGRLTREVFASEAEAAVALQRQARAKLHRGYR